MNFKKVSETFTPKCRNIIFNPSFEYKRQWYKKELFYICAKLWCEENPDEQLIIGYKNIKNNTK